MNSPWMRAIAARTAVSGLALVCMAFSFMASAAPNDDIRDIRGPRPLASPWLVWALVGAGMLVAVLAYVLWRWIKRRRSLPPKTDVELALGRLEAARALMQPGHARDFSIEVSAIVREYIERRFRVMAAHRTTHEFLHDLVLSATPGLTAHREPLGEFLQSCDLAKFGGWNLDIDQMSTMLESAQRFVRSVLSAPASESATAGAAPAGANLPNSLSKSRVSFPST